MSPRLRHANFLRRLVGFRAESPIDFYPLAKAFADKPGFLDLDPVVTVVPSLVRGTRVIKDETWDQPERIAEMDEDEVARMLVQESRESADSDPYTGQ
jgi:hypothetical protein